MTAPATTTGKTHQRITSRVLRNALADRLRELNGTKKVILRGCLYQETKINAISEISVAKLHAVIDFTYIQSAIDSGAYLGKEF